MSARRLGTESRYGIGIPELESEYDFIGELGRGGTAVVYHARDRELGRDVAIKVVRASHADDEEAVSRLAREARTVAQLAHPNIVTLYAVKRLHDRRLALVMQLVPGLTLRDTLAREGELDVERAEQILVDIAEALAHAHAQGIVHRDVKPENIFLDAKTGRAMLSDFGIARTETDTLVTVPGTAIGTPTYMSPEQIDGAPVDGRSDLYSLGCVAWEMLTGRRPWEGESLYSVVYRQKKEDLPGIDDVRPDVPDRLVYAIERLLKKRPDERWDSVAQFAAELPDAVPPSGWWRWHAERRRRARSRAYDSARERGASPITAALETIRFTRRTSTPQPNEPAAPTAEPNETAAAAGAAAAAGIIRSPNPRSARVATPARAHRAAAARREHPRRRMMLVIVGGLVAAGAASALVVAKIRENAARPVPPTVFADRRAIEIPVTPALTPSLVMASPLGDSTAAADSARPDTAAARATATTTPATTPAARPAATRDSAKAATERTTPRPDTARRTIASAAAATPVRPPARPSTPTATRLTDSAMRAESAAAARAGAVTMTFETGVLAAGGRHTCALTSDGAPLCWGANDRGQLGDGTTTDHATAVRVATELRFVQVATGVTSTCGIARGGDAYCWGENDRGQLGDGTSTARQTPVRVTGAPALRSVRVGLAHACGITPAGGIICWGANGAGQLGTGGQPGQVTEPSVARWAALATGWYHTCALAADGSAWCWGRNTNGQLGDGTTTDRRLPTRVSADVRFVSIAAGASHSCGVTTDGAVFCWGRNNNGQLGTGDATDHATPTRVDDVSEFVAVTAGTVHSCGRTRGGQARCWGRNSFGQLGDGSTADRLRPVGVTGAPALTAVYASASHTCGVTALGETFCWGYNSDGQLGDGTRENKARPARVVVTSR
jgi:alpha-tubulin suppressor-like RCC1 family protein/tRNA A-37 threonylcarbamoyl transferase component Bud32